LGNAVLVAGVCMTAGGFTALNDAGAMQQAACEKQEMLSGLEAALSVDEKAVAAEQVKVNSELIKARTKTGFGAASAMGGSIIAGGALLYVTARRDKKRSRILS